jgi:(1->4)-alpha-D-glucan 1-alpha-D-glucosylmutase
LWNSLSQTLLKLTCPGVPDIYQGNDLWDLSLVDPDNRRPVDYLQRRQVFESIRKLGSDPDVSSVQPLIDASTDGRLKLYLIWKTLCLRKQWPDIFQSGEYLPLTVQGAKANHVVAYVRKLENTSMLVVVPRLIGSLLAETGEPPIGSHAWEDTALLVSSWVGPGSCRNVFTGETINVPQPGAQIAISDLLAHFPVALCLLS